MSKSGENFHFCVDSSFKEPDVMQRPETCRQKNTFVMSKKYSFLQKSDQLNVQVE